MPSHTVLYIKKFPRSKPRPAMSIDCADENHDDLCMLHRLLALQESLASGAPFPKFLQKRVEHPEPPVDQLNAEELLDFK